MYKLLTLLSLVFLTACTVPVAQHNGYVIVKDSEGGLLEHTRKRVVQMRRNNQTAILKQDFCWSACTMYLSVAECVGSDTQFGFHSTTIVGLLPSDYDTRVLSEYYPGKLKDWYLNTSASNYNPFGPSSTLTGTEVSKLTGIPVCKSTD